MTTAEREKIEQETLHLLSTDEGKKLFVDLVIESLGDEGMNSLASRLQLTCENTSDDAEFAAKLGVRNYSKEEKKALELISMLKFFEYRKKLLANALPNSHVAEMLGVSRQTPHDRVKAGQLLGILDNNVLKFPEWQFDPEGPNGVVQGLAEVLAALRCGTFAKMSWLSTANPIFEGIRPIDALKMGLVEAVVHEALAVGIS